MLHDKMTKEELLTLALFDNGGGNPILGTKTLTANGTYTASDDSLQGYSSVTVDIDDTDLYRDTTDSTYESVKTLSNCGAFPMLSLTAEINAVQDLHGYDHPWAGGAGKNKFDEANPDKWIFTDGNLTDDEGSMTSQLIDVTAGQTWTLSIANDISTLCICFYDSSMNLLNRTAQASVRQISATAPSNSAYMYGSSFKHNNKLQLEIGSTATTYSPYSNICPISGWDSIDVYQSKKNLLNVNDSYTIRTQSRIATLTLSARTYTFSLYCVNNTSIVGYARIIDNSSNTLIANINLDGDTEERYSCTFTLTETTEIVITMQGQTTGYNYTISELMIEEGSTATTYEAYNGQTYTTALSTTCYGATKELISGAENITHGHIASYNGETLPSTWISDRDEYAEGTTPTIGAEVVYELATPTTATSDAIDLTLAEGVNNLWADSGDVGDARYFRKVEL